MGDIKCQKEYVIEKTTRVMLFLNLFFQYIYLYFFRDVRMIRAKDFVKQSDFQDDLNLLKKNYTFLYNSSIIHENDTPEQLFMNYETNLIFIVENKLYNLKRRTDAGKGLLLEEDSLPIKCIII